MKILKKTIMSIVLLFGVGGVANAAFVINTISAGVDDLDMTFSWDGTVPTDLESIFTSAYWSISAKTNPGATDPATGIFVGVKHEGVGDGRTHYFSNAGSTLNWEHPHNGGTDFYSLSYVSLVGSGPSYGGAVLNLTGSHVAPVPVPAALWLFGSGLLAVVGFGKLRRKEISVAA